MPQVILTRRAWNDLGRLRAFIAQKNPSAAQRAAKRIIQAIDQLAVFPLLGRPCPTEKMPADFRELVIDFGNDGYVALYRLEDEQITIVAIRHQREAGFDVLGKE